MKKLYLLIILFVATFIATQAGAQQGDTVRVLFLGNSFTGANNMPGLFENLAQAAGRKVIVRMHAPGGVYIGDTRPGAPSHAYDPMVHNLLKSERWDYVVAQDNQGHYSYTLGWYPPYAEVYKGHQAIRDTLLRGNPCGKLILFSGWCFKNGWPGEFPDGKSMNQRVYENYVFANKTIKEIVSPIGIAWNRVMDSIPAINLWSPDEAHPSLEGSYVTAATVYATIFRSSPDSARFDGGLPASQAGIMRRAAYAVVMDSSAPTGLAPHTLSLTATGTQLTAGAGFKTYQWYHSGKITGTTTTATYTPPVSGCYQVIGIDAAGCRKRSAVVCMSKPVVPAGIGTIERSGISVFPNPAFGRVQLQLETPVRNAEVYIIDLQGRTVYRSQPGSAQQFSIDLPALQAGVYELRLVSAERSFRQRLVIAQP